MWWAPVTHFDPADWMDDRVADGTDLFSQFALAAAHQAVADAGLADPGALLNCAPPWCMAPRSVGSGR